MTEQVTLTDNNIIMVREIIIKDGKEVYHRYCLSPGDDLTGQPPEVIEIARESGVFGI